MLRNTFLDMIYTSCFPLSNNAFTIRRPRSPRPPATATTVMTRGTAQGTGRLFVATTVVKARRSSDGRVVCCMPWSVSGNKYREWLEVGFRGSFNESLSNLTVSSSAYDMCIIYETSNTCTFDWSISQDRDMLTVGSRLCSAAGQSY